MTDADPTTAPGGPSPEVPWTPGEEPSRVGTTNGFAVASFVTGLFGLLPLALAFGVAALRRIPRLGQRGTLFATAGVALGTLVGAALTAALVLGYPAYQAATFDGVPLEKLDPGTCVNGHDGRLGAAGVPVECAEPHDGETYHRLEVPGASFPGQEQVDADMEKRCLAAFEEYVGLPYRSSRFDFIYVRPTAATWRRGDKTAACAIVPVGEGPPLVGSVEGVRQ